MHDNTLLNKTIQVTTKTKTKLDMTAKFGRIRQNEGHAAILPFKVIQGHRFWYQSKAHIRLPISRR